MTKIWLNKSKFSISKTPKTIDRKGVIWDNLHMKALAHKLEKLGLEEKESLVYLATLEAAFGISIAALVRKTGIKRSTVYLALESLKRKGLISVSGRGSRHIYLAEEPQVFEKKLEDESRYFKTLLPELLSLANVIRRKPQIRFYEGEEGIKEVYRDTLEYPDGEICAWATDDIDEYFDVEWLTNNYVQVRVKNKIRARVLAPNKPHMRELAGENTAVLRTLRLLSSEDAPFSIEVNLYGGRKMALVSFRESFGIIIESTEIHSTFKAIFESAWKNSQSVV